MVSGKELDRGNQGPHHSEYARFQAQRIRVGFAYVITNVLPNYYQAVTKRCGLARSGDGDGG